MTHTGTLKLLDEVERALVFADGVRVEMDEVIAIESDSQ